MKLNYKIPSFETIKNENIILEKVALATGRCGKIIRKEN
jgi:hypothetical protein